MGSPTSLIRISGNANCWKWFEGYGGAEVCENLFFRAGIAERGLESALNGKKFSQCRP